MSMQNSKPATRSLRRTCFDTASIALIAAAVQLVSAPAAAQNMSGKEAASQDNSASQFSQLDGNRDGYIDSKEAAASPSLTALLANADKNGDRKLSEDEFRLAMKSH